MILHRLTVASVACLRLSISKMILTWSGIWICSPFGKVNILLLSSTELRFSTHNGSTSPSNTIQCLCCEFVYSFSFTHLKIFVSTPSVQLNVISFKSPYSSFFFKVFGSILYISPFVFSSVFKQLNSVSRQTDLPVTV